MNKKGFIISTTLYSLFGIMVFIVFYILYALTANRTLVTAQTKEIKTCMDSQIVVKNCEEVEECERCNEKDNISQNIIAEYSNFKPIETKNTYSYDDYYYSMGPSCEAHAFHSKENGLFYHSLTNQYYFRGDVGDNYVMFGDELFRIIGVYPNFLTMIRETSIEETFFPSSRSTPDYEFVHNTIDIALKNWISAFEIKIGRYDIVEEMPFCIDTWNNQINNVNCTSFAYQKAGLLSVQEAVRAGLYPMIVSGGCPEFYAGTCLGTYENNSFLTTGSPTLLSTKYSANSFMAMSNTYNPSHGSSAYWSKGILIQRSTGTGTIPNHYSVMKKAVRPVITVYTNLLEFRGKGTKVKPYVLTVK